MMPSHTDMGAVFDAFGGLQRGYNWLLSGDEQFFASGRPMWLTGDELTDRVEGGWSRFGWGIFSGFLPGVTPEEPNARYPFADGNRGFWRPYPKPQHPQAFVEIVCFDNSMTLLLSFDPELAARFRAKFTEAQDLDGFIDDVCRPVYEAWSRAATDFPLGEVVTAAVLDVGQTTASVELAPSIITRITVRQMRTAGFGPSHWYRLHDHLQRGQRVDVRVLTLDPEAMSVDVEFVQLSR